jgi:hypothetical protein
MEPTGDPYSTVAAGQADARRKLSEELLQISEWLSIVVDAYEEKPSTIDIDILNTTDCAVDIKGAITKVYRVMKTRVYTVDSPLRADEDVWEAFKEQQDEFIGFYKSALKALDIYKDVLQAYSLVRGKARRRPRHGHLERIRQDKHAHVAERAGCIEAVSDFYSKFSAMLTVLSSN